VGDNAYSGVLPPFTRVRQRDPDKLMPDGMTDGTTDRVTDGTTDGITDGTPTGGAAVVQYLKAQENFERSLKEEESAVDKLPSCKTKRLPRAATSLLQEWWREHIVWPYPSVCTSISTTSISTTSIYVS
jgi:hypothetical protein